MLSFAGLALRQCTQRAALRSLPALPARTFATHPVLCQHYPSHTPVQPQWTDNGKHFSRNSRVAYQWEFVTDISERYTKTLASKTPEEIWSSWENGLVKNLPPPHHAYSGRSVKVERGDVAGALHKLNDILSANGVRSAHIRDERHEKKGEKRNRLKSLRWRRRFAHEVRKKVLLVKQIRARGA